MAEEEAVKEAKVEEEWDENGLEGGALYRAAKTGSAQRDAAIRIIEIEASRFTMKDLDKLFRYAEMVKELEAL